MKNRKKYRSSDYFVLYNLSIIILLLPWRRQFYGYTVHYNYCIVKCGIMIIPTLEMHFFIQVYIKSKFCEVSLLVLLIIIVKDLWINVAVFFDIDMYDFSDTLPLVDMYGLEGLKEVIVCSLKVEKCHLFHKVSKDELKLRLNLHFVTMHSVLFSVKKHLNDSFYVALQ